jgi:hypothetical protein
MEIHTITTIDATPERVWDVLTDAESYERWNPMIRDLEGALAPGSKIKFAVRLTRTMKAPLTAEVTTAKRGRSLRWVGPAATWSRRLVSGEHYFELAELAGRKTRFEHGESFGGLLIPARGARLASLMTPMYERFNAALAREVSARATRS